MQSVVKGWLFGKVTKMLWEQDTFILTDACCEITGSDETLC